MHCEGCARRLEHALRLVQGVTSVNVDFQSQKVVVGFVSERTSFEDLKRVITEAGFEA